MEKFFITGTGTVIGKTFVTTTLCHQLIKTGKKVIALKPVISGYDSEDMQSDTALILKSCNLPVTQENIGAISPWRFSHPLSPNMAAHREGRHIKFPELVKYCKTQENIQADILLLEGVGGVCVPLNNENTTLDLMVALNDWKIILVGGSYLGSISHILTAYETLAGRGLKLHSLIISESENSPVGIGETMETLRDFLPKYVSITAVPRQPDNNMNGIPNLTGIFL